MKELLTRTLAALALVTLIAAPAAAAGPESTVEPPARTDALVEPAATTETPADAPIEVQVPADLPDRGHACVLPPQQQTDPCICPLIFDPVCGCDGVTYSNSCFASCVVRTWDEGACE